MTNLTTLPPEGEGAERALTPTVDYTDKAILSGAVLVDGAGAVFTGYHWLNGNDTGWKVDKWVNGAAAGHWEGVLNPFLKLDWMTMCQAGTDILLYAGGHTLDQAPNRHYRTWNGAIPGVATAYPGGTPRGMATDTAAWVAAAPPPVPDPTPGYTLAQIADAVATEIQARLNGDMGGQIEKQAKTGARAALVEEVKPGGALGTIITTANMGDVYAHSAAIFNQLNNVDGAQAWEALIGSGLVPASRAPDWVKKLDGYPWGGSG